MSDHAGPEQTTDIIARHGVRFLPPGEWVTMPAAEYDALGAERDATRPLVEAALAYAAACDAEESADESFREEFYAAVGELERCHDALMEAAVAYAARHRPEGEVG